MRACKKSFLFHCEAVNHKMRAPELLPGLKMGSDLPNHG